MCYFHSLTCCNLYTFQFHGASIMHYSHIYDVFNVYYWPAHNVTTYDTLVPSLLRRATECYTGIIIIIIMALQFMACHYAFTFHLVHYVFLFSSFRRRYNTVRTCCLRAQKLLLGYSWSIFILSQSFVFFFFFSVSVHVRFSLILLTLSFLRCFLH